MTELTTEKLACPKCRSQADFQVVCPEYKHYIYRGADGTWTPDDDYDVDCIPNIPFTVTCLACGHIWEEEPWD